jgi:hypothetical protein
MRCSRRKNLDLGVAVSEAAGSERQLDHVRERPLGHTCADLAFPPRQLAPPEPDFPERIVCQSIIGAQQVIERINDA